MMVKKLKSKIKISWEISLNNSIKMLEDQMALKLSQVKKLMITGLTLLY